MEMLNDLVELARKATPGEWQQKHRKCFDPTTNQNWYNTQVFTSDGETVATLAWYPKDEGHGVTGTYREDNAKFIAAANPEAIIAIAEAFRALEKRAEAAEAKLAGLERQEPVAWIHQTTGAMLRHSVTEEVRKKSGVWIPLYCKRKDIT